MKSPLAIFFRVLFLIVVVSLLVVGGALSYFTSWRADRLAALGSESEIVETPAGKVEVLTRGEGDPLLVFHGALGGYDQAVLLADTLAGGTSSVIAPSRPGYLRTPLASGILPEQQADLMLALLDKLEVPSADVLAFGEGVPAALQFALKYPARVQKLVIASPVLQPPPAGKSRFPEEIMAGMTGDVGSWILSEVAHRDPTEILNWIFPRESLRSPIQQKEARQFILDSPEQREDFQELVDTVVPMDARGPGTRNDLVQERSKPPIAYDKITVPVLVIQGELDAVTSTKEGEAMAAKIPGSQYAVIPATGHLLMLGPGTEEASQRIESFLASQAPVSEPAAPAAPAQP